MKSYRTCIALLAALLLFAAFPVRALAWGPAGETYRFPTITVVAYHAPEDLELKVEVQKNGESFTADTRQDRRGWETSFRLYREDVFRANSFSGNDRDFAGSVLLCRTGGEERRIPVPKECLTVGGSRDVMTLDCETWTLSPGLPAWRAPVLLGLRVLMVLAVKALIFLVMGYREGRSWLCFLLVNLATQIPLNLIINGRIWVNELNWNSAVFIGLTLFCLVVILGLETMLMATLVTEHDRNRTGTYVAIANLAGIVTLFAGLSLLPI